MKKNKLLSLIAAIALTAGTSVMPVFADENGNSTEDNTETTQTTTSSNFTVANGGNFNIGKTYTVNSGTAPSEAFQLENLKYESSSNVAKAADINLLPTISATSSIASGTADFSVKLPTYTGVGEFVYSFNEKDGGTAGVTYDGTTYYMVVQVLNNDSSTEGATAFICNVAIHSGSATGSKVTGITNKYDSGTLTVSKSVTGNMGDKTKEFAVTVTFTAPTDDTVRSTIKYTEDSTEKTVTFAEGSTTASATINLHDTESVTFTNIPAGVTYTVAESDYTKKADGEYDAAEYTYSDKEEKKISANDTDTVTVTNNKGVNVDTGIITDNAPYIAIIGVVAVCAVVFVARKKHSEE